MLTIQAAFAQTKTKQKTKNVAGCPTVTRHWKKPAFKSDRFVIDAKGSTSTVTINRGKVYVNDSLITTVKYPRYEDHTIVINYVPPEPINEIKPVTYTGNRALPLLGVVTCSDCDGGARIEEVIPCSPAEKAGLQPGDVITKVGNHEITGKSQLRETVRTYNVGDEVAVSYLHAGMPKTAEASLGDKEKVENSSCAREDEGGCNKCNSCNSWKPYPYTCHSCKPRPCRSCEW